MSYGYKHKRKMRQIGAKRYIENKFKSMNKNPICIFSYPQIEKRQVIHNCKVVDLNDWIKLWYEAKLNFLFRVYYNLYNIDQIKGF